LDAANVCVRGAKFSWVGWLLWKVHSKLLQNCKANYRASKERKQYVWSDACGDAFKNLKKLLSTSPMFAQPDIANLFDVYCDASGTGLGGVLMQEGQVISYSL
jgi:hypothetical protein